MILYCFDTLVLNAHIATYLTHNGFKFFIKSHLNFQAALKRYFIIRWSNLTGIIRGLFSTWLGLKGHGHPSLFGTKRWYSHALLGTEPFKVQWHISASNNVLVAFTRNISTDHFWVFILQTNQCFQKLAVRWKLGKQKVI